MSIRGKLALCLAALTSLCATTGCDFTKFDDLEGQATTIALEQPEGYPGAGFGSAIATYEGLLMGQQVSRIAINGGAQTPVVTYVGWNGSTVLLGNPKETVCGSSTDCKQGYGVSFGGVAAYGMGQEVCVIMPSAEDVRVKCELSTASLVFPAPVGERFGGAVATLAAGSRFGVALIGAPGGAGGGKVYSFSSGGAVAPITGLENARLTAGTLGDRLAVAEVGATRNLLVAATTRAGTSARIVVAHLAEPGVAEVRACLESSSPVFGNAVLVRDLDRDGFAEVVVGVNADPETPDKATAIDIYPGTGLPGTSTGTCAPWGAPAVRVSCPDHDGVSCVGSGFGSSLAAGDVDGDGADELIVGAPTATARGEPNAGALFVLAGRAGQLPTGTNSALLTHSTPEANAMLGSAVATVRSTLATRPRAEIVAGAPGASVVYVFLCSGYGDDLPTLGPRCLPAPPSTP